jgi:hypothetical protein
MKTTMLAVLVSMVLGCGGPENSGQEDALNSNQSEAQADLWAEGAYGLYGADAVRACLAEFHAGYAARARGGGDDYRAALAQYMCSCARGPSKQPCPQP